MFGFLWTIIFLPDVADFQLFLVLSRAWFQVHQVVSFLNPFSLVGNQLKRQRVNESFFLPELPNVLPYFIFKIFHPVKCMLFYL